VCERLLRRQFPIDTTTRLQVKYAVPLRKTDIFSTLVIPTFFVISATVWIRLADIDLRVQRHFWNGTKGLWKFAEESWAVNVYNLGVMPALVVGMLSLVVLLIGIGRQDIARYRKVAGYLALTLLIGSGIITNALLKGLWGRPRPSQLSEFGGHMAFEPVLTWAQESFGKSFPCGHATMGFFFWAVALAIPQRMAVIRYLIAAFGSALGVALGWVRSAQGGHFVSDTLWAAAIMWFVAVGLFHAMRLGESRAYIPRHTFKRQVPTWAMACYVPIIGLALFLCLLGTPYKDSYTLKDSAIPKPVNRVIVNVDGDVEVIPGETFRVEARSEGFGVPNSSFKFKHSIEENGDLRIRALRKGFFTELRTTLTVTVPEAHQTEVICEGASRLITSEAAHKTASTHSKDPDLPNPPTQIVK
jgi:lipid A 4'-phosphatase